MYRLVNTTNRVISKTVAREFAEMETIPHDRPLSKRRLEIYTRVMQNNQFRGPEWTKVYCKETNRTYRVNGKHTSTLFSRFDNQFGVKATISTYEADTFEDVVKLYGTFDSRMQTRNQGDINAAFSACLPELVAYPRKLINDIVTGVNYAFYGKAFWNKQPTERAEILLDEDIFKFSKWLKDNLYDGVSPRNHIWKSPIVSAIFITYRRNKEDALKFWQSVRDETGSVPNLPCRTLAKYLMTNAKATNFQEFEGVYVRSLHAWNAFRTNKKITNLNYFKNTSHPKVV